MLLVVDLELGTASERVNENKKSRKWNFYFFCLQPKCV